MTTLIADPRIDKYMSSGILADYGWSWQFVSPSSWVSDAEVRRFIAALTQCEDTLHAWLRDPSALADDETDAPSHKTVQRALVLTQCIKAAVAQRPSTVDTRWTPRGVSIGTGGSISLEFEQGQFGLTVVIEPSGHAEFMTFVANKITRRHRIEV